jgi:hypothetical protein
MPNGGPIRVTHNRFSAANVKLVLLSEVRDASRRVFQDQEFVSAPQNVLEGDRVLG